MDIILKVENLKKYYGQEPNQTKALDGVSFEVFKGEFLGIMGSSGSGKTTLLNCLATITQPSDGTIKMGEQYLNKLTTKKLATYRGKEIGYLFQNFELLENLNGEENILLPLSLHNVKEEDMQKRLKLLSEYFDITTSLQKFPNQMSGGQKQRVAAARALILSPQIILADEPTGALDSQNAKKLMQKLAMMNQVDTTTILMVTHDQVAASYCQRILIINDGKIHHELRRDLPNESREAFYQRIVKVMATLVGGEINVF